MRAALLAYRSRAVRRFEPRTVALAFSFLVGSGAGSAVVGLTREPISRFPEPKYLPMSSSVAKRDFHFFRACGASPRTALSSRSAIVPFLSVSGLP
jgi:hypothetical protein